MASLTAFQGKLGKKYAAHLLRRITFGPTKREIDTFAEKTPEEALADLLKALPPLPDPIDPDTGQTWINRSLEGEKVDHDALKQHLKAWWIDEMVHSPLSVIPKLSYFLHTHFTTIESRISYSQSIYYQIRLFRHFALGNLKVLSKKICLDNAMLRFLDGDLNEAGRPNENFAREFLELYTIGKGPQIGPSDYTHYTEDDIIEAAKIFSGYQEDKNFTHTDPETGLSQALLKTDGNGLASRHDASVKTFSHAFEHQTIAPSQTANGLATEEAAEDEINQLVDMVFAKPETARHFSRKLYRFFVYYQISEETEAKVIAPMAEILLENNYAIEPVLQALFTSQHFYDADNHLPEDNVVGAMIKSPLELVVGSLRFFQVNLPQASDPIEQYYQAYESGILKPLRWQGLDFYEPFEVAGYPAYHQSPAFHRNWISANYLARRYEYSKHIIQGIRNENDEMLFRLDIVEYVKQPNNITDPENARLLVEELLGYLLPEIITTERFDYFLKVILLDDLSEINWKKEWQRFQATGDDSAVRIQLENLVNTIMQSPEYQLS